MDVLAQLFGIKDSSSCIFGGTVLDTNLSSGYDKEKMNPPKNEVTLNPQLGIYLYPVIKELQSVYKEGSFPLSMMDTWVNGFAVNNKGSPSPDNMCSKSVEMLDTCSVMKTSQLVKSHDQSLLSTLFYFFKFYKHEDNRILNLDSFTEENKAKLITKGMVCSNWLENPLQVRYVIRKEGKSNLPDYLYLIGGSEDLISDNPSDGIDIIKSSFHYTSKKPGKNSSNLRYIWNDMSTSDVKESTKKFVEFTRLLCGFICIRNYLYYAYHDLKIDTLIEFNGSSIKKVQTKKILELYEEVYQYCRTIALLVA